jgi:GNAT superfamily N-acetyltransferase
MEFLIRPLDFSDYDEVINLWVKSGLPYRPKGRDSREAMEKEFKREETGIFGMFDGDRLIGAIVGTSDGRKGWINRLAVDPDYRGRGLAARLIEEAENFLYGLGLKVIAALIEDYNTPSISAFIKAGYDYGESVRYLSKRTSEDD